jgi:hypothetical protein
VILQDALRVAVVAGATHANAQESNQIGGPRNRGAKGLGESVTTRILLICALICFPCATESAQLQLSGRDVAVLTAVLSHFASRPDTWPATPGGYIAVSPDTDVVPPDTRPDAFLDELNRIRKLIPMEAVADFDRRNHNKQAVPPVLAKTVRIRIQSLEEAGGSPIGFHNHQIATFITTYAPGYTTDGTKALVRFRFNWAVHGADATYLLRLKQDKWSVLASELTVFP